MLLGTVYTGVYERSVYTLLTCYCTIHLAIVAFALYNSWQLLAMYMQ
jgi:hypothetical protein